MKFGFDDKEFSFQFLRMLGLASSGQTNVGECIATAAEIAEGDFESWANSWAKTACRVEDVGRLCQENGKHVSASEAFLRASSYFRAAEFFLHGNSEDPRILNYADKSQECFYLWLQHAQPNAKRVEIPYEGTSLPGIFFSAGSKKAPTLIVQTGFDGTIEGLTHWAQAAVKRGWHCLTFEGPGQGQILRKENLKFRPDWEKVIGAVVDYLVQDNTVREDQIALMGLSFGGYLAPKAVTSERRICACIANGGVLDFLGPNIPPGVSREEFEEMLSGQEKEVNAELSQMMEKDSSMRWVMENGMFSFGGDSPAVFLRNALQYNLLSNADQIQCPTLVIDVENEHCFPGEAKKLFEALSCPKTWIRFTAEEGAGEHCQTASPTLAEQRIFDWLQETVVSVS